MIEIREPTEADRPQMVDLMRVAFNVPSPWVRHISPSFRLDRFRCAFEGGRLVGMTQVWDLAQWFGGRSLSMAGIAAVAAVPERRGEGIAPEVMREVLREQRSRGILVSTLYPSRAAVYRRLGYEYSGILTQYRVPLADLHADGEGTVEEMREDDLGAVRACYTRFAQGQHGCVESQDDDWWRIRVVRKWNPDVTSRAVVVRGGGGVDGYATFAFEPLTDTWGYRINCFHLVGATPAAVRALLSYFRGFRGMGQVLAWYGPAHEPMGLLIAGGGESLQPARTVRFMTRLLDVPGALAARGYLPVSGSATIAIHDDLIPENDGPFRIEARDGCVTVERTAASSAPRIPIAAFSALYTGYASAADLVRVGLIDGGDPALPFLAALFAGPTPWMTDFF